MSLEFGEYLKGLRLEAGFGLREFALIIGERPSNLSSVEHGRRQPPKGKLRDMAEALGLVEGTEDWAKFFDLAKKDNELPEDIASLANSDLTVQLLRSTKTLSTEDLEALVKGMNNELPVSGKTDSVHENTDREEGP